jgi:hypothetical protein
LESRPFLELPNPFLCAIVLCDYLVHPQFGEMLPVPDRALILLFALKLENGYLLGAVIGSDRSDHFGCAQLRLGKHLAVFEYCEDVGKLERRPDIERQLRDADNVAWRHPVLLSTSLNDCVHETSLRPGTPRARSIV